MNITLRQAHKLVDKIHGRLATISISATQSVNIWEAEDALATFQRLEAEFNTAVERNNSLLSARQDIRDLIQRENVGAINGIIVRRKMVLDEIGGIRHILGTIQLNSIGSPTALKNKVAADRASQSAGGRSIGYGADSINICILGATQRAEYETRLASLQLEVEQLEDRLTQLNASRGIVLPADVVAILQKEGLVLV